MVQFGSQVLSVALTRLNDMTAADVYIGLLYIVMMITEQYNEM